MAAGATPAALSAKENVPIPFILKPTIELTEAGGTCLLRAGGHLTESSTNRDL
jgi:hypothetical protein